MYEDIFGNWSKLCACSHAESAYNYLVKLQIPACLLQHEIFVALQTILLQY
jgi:hypothetical protein